MRENQYEDITITVDNIYSAEATTLLDELSEQLKGITGDSGRSSFDVSDMEDVRAVFVIARNKNNMPLGCGCIRPLGDDIAELKRMYVKEK